MKKNKNINFIIAMIVLLCAAGMVAKARQPSKMGEGRLKALPRIIGDWQGEDAVIDERVYEILETRNVLIRDYKNKNDSRIINLQIVYSGDNRKVAHPPEVCIVGSGAEVALNSLARISINSRNIPVNKLISSADSSRTMLLYCYFAGDEITANYYVQQAKVVINKFRNKNAGTAMIKVGTVILDDESKALEALTEFLRQILPVLPQYLT